MERSFLKNALIIITYTALLGLVLVRFDFILEGGSALLSALSPILGGFALAFVLSRPCNFFDRLYCRHLPFPARRWARPLAVATAYLLLILVIGGILAFVLPQVADSIALFLGSLEGALANLQITLTTLINYLDLESLKSLQFDFTALSGYLNDILGGMAGSVGTAAGQVMAMTGTFFGYLITAVLAIVFSIYMLSGGDTLRRQCGRMLDAYVPKKTAQRIQHIVDISATVFSNFVSGQLTEACILGVLCTLGTLFIQADYAPLIGVIVGVSALIPVAGAYIGAILGAFFILMVSPLRALIFLIFLTVLQQIEGNVIYPRVVGSSIGLPGIWVLAAVTVGGGLFGLTGILFAVPVVSILYTLLREDVTARLHTANPSEASSDAQDES